MKPQKRLECANCDLWKLIEGKGRCRYRDIHRYAWEMTCNTFRQQNPEPEPEPETSEEPDIKYEILASERFRRLECHDCDSWVFQAKGGYCKDHKVHRFSWDIACGFFKQQNPEPEPEPEPSEKYLPDWRKTNTEAVIYTIDRYLKGYIPQLNLVDALTSLDADYLLTIRIANDLTTLKARATKTESLPPTPPTSHWIEHLVTLRDQYVSGEIDMDIVQKALDPSQTENIIVEDLINAWEQQRMRNDTCDAPHEVFDPDEDDLPF